MKQKQIWYWLLLLFFFACSGANSGHMNDTPSSDSLDSLIRYHAFSTLVHRRTGVVYDVPLPSNLSGVNAAVVRMRGRSLWLKGIRIKSIRIPPTTVSIPPVGRLVIVYQNLGNWSASYYKVKNYSLITPIIGLLAYDDYGNSSGNKVDFNVVKGDPIIVSFPKVNLNSTKAKCVSFGSMGSQSLYNVMANNECSMQNGGHFSIVVPKQEVIVHKSVMKKRRIWVISVLGGVVGLIVLCLVGVVIVRFMKRKRMEKMSRRAEEGEVLETVWVSGSKMPSASVSRTQPVLENGSAP